MTALEEEREAVLRKLPGNRKHDQRDRDVLVYYDATIASRRRDGARYRVIVTSLGHMGPIVAAGKMAPLVQRWNPSRVFLVGIAGGVSGKVQLGDVMVASHIADYTVGKRLPDGDRETRWTSHRTDESLLVAADNFSAGWTDLIHELRPGTGRPARRIGVVASGGEVIASPRAVGELERAYARLIGVEMEGAGLATGLVNCTPQPRFLMIRGVSDLADGRRNAATKAQWRAYAADVAASYAVGLLRMGPFEQA